MSMEVLQKYWKLILFILVVASNFALAALLYFSMHHSSELKSQLDDANNVLNAKVAEVQSFNAKLGLAQAELFRQKDLEKKYKEDLSSMDKDLKGMIAKYKLSLKSRDQTIASLKSQIKGGTTTVTVNGNTVSPNTPICDNKIISYMWKTVDGRFALTDPDISIPNNETFNSSQSFVITGYVFADSTGQLQIRKIELKEVIEKQKEDGTKYLEPVPGAKITILDSKLEYTNKLGKSKEWTDMFHLRGLASFDTALHPGLGLEVANLGRWIDWANIGLYAKVGFDLTNNFSNMQNSTIGAGVSYHLIPPLLDTNLAIGASVNFPFSNLKQPMFMVDAIFYLTN